MSGAAGHPALTAALDLSREVVEAADRGDMVRVAQLDGERLQLLKAFRCGAAVGAVDQRQLAEIAELNDRALGLMEHHLRIAARALDVATVGRRAVDAYASNRSTR